MKRITVAALSFLLTTPSFSQYAPSAEAPQSKAAAAPALPKPGPATIAPAPPMPMPKPRPVAAEIPKPPAPLLSAAVPFKCDDLVPHSDAYDNGNYGAAFKELEPIAIERCAEAEHLLGVMYAKGQGAQVDPVRAYALFLLAHSDGMGPVPKKAIVPYVGDDEDELEVVQFGAQLTADQINQAEALAIKLANKKGRFATAETAGPSEVAKSAKELRPRLAGYRLNGKLAEIGMLASAAPRTASPAQILAQIVTDQNAHIIPAQLSLLERRSDLIAPGSEDDLNRLNGIAAKQGERFEWLKVGTSVRVVKFTVNYGFAAQIEPMGERDFRQRYWVNSCYLAMKDAQDQVLWQIAKVGGCAR
jgi:hypothetical protein